MIRLAWVLTAADAREPAAVAERLSTGEFDGIDWSADRGEAALHAGRLLVAANVPIVCVAARAELPARWGTSSAWLDPVREWVMVAAELGAQRLRVSIGHASTRRFRPSPVRFAEQLAAVAELADGQGVQVLLQTTGEFANPTDLWRTLELSGSKNLAVCLSRPFQNAGESSLDTHGLSVRSNTVSVLNLRIRHAHFFESVALVHVDRIAQHTSATDLHHLRGIGFDGWLSIETPDERIAQRSTEIRAAITPSKATKPSSPSKK